MHYRTGITVPEGYVALDYKMDPKTEDLIRGTKLIEGMVVLSEDMREDPMRHVEGYVGSYMPGVYDRVRLETMSQWCRVTELSVDREITSFVGVYSDGSKRSRKYNQQWFWFVKI